MAVSCSTLPYLVACLMHIFMTVQATTNIRINGTSSRGSVGRIEVFYNGTWGTVCDDWWDLNDARVACQQLGFSDAVAALQGNKVDHGTGKIWLDDVACSGDESSIFDCADLAFGKHNCDHSEDAGVNCFMPDIRINGTSSRGSVGRIEVFYNGTWGTVCDDGWDINDARVACQQLGFSDAVAALQGTSVDHGTGKIWLENVACSGNESSIFDCVHSAFGKHDCDHKEDAGVNCSMPDDLRLKAQVNCRQNVILKENENFSCRCKAVRVRIFPTATWIKSFLQTATWIKSGQIISGPSADGDQELSLSNVGKDASGTYKCRAQLYTLIVEKSINITVQYQPRIIYFHAIISKDGSIVLICHAEGLPKPNYAIYSDALEIKGMLNGVAIIRNCSSNSNTTYTCTAWNNLGKYKKQLSHSFSKMITSSQPPIASSGKHETKATDFYYILIAAIAGLIVGICSLYGMQRICRSKRNVNHAEHQVGVDVDEEEQQVSDTALYEQPNVSASSLSPQYEELNLAKLREEREMSHYQSLLHQPGMNRKTNSPS